MKFGGLCRKVNNRDWKKIKHGKSCFVDSPFEGKIQVIIDNIRNIYQRARYGFCESDLYEMDTWFLKVIPAMLEYLKNRNLSFPLQIYKEMPGVQPEDDEDGKLAFKKWNQTLTKMIKAFKNLDAFDEKIEGKIYTHQIFGDKDEAEIREKLKDKAFSLFSKWFFELWW